MTKQSAILGGRFLWQRWRGHTLVAWGYCKNGPTNEGLNYVLNSAFDAGTVITTWYVGLIKTLTTLAAADTMASHAGWTESTDYTEAVRQTWTTDPATAQFLCNDDPMQFTMNAEVTIDGFFLVSVNTKGGTTGTLWATAQLDVPQKLPINEVLKIFYELEAKAG